MRIQHNYSNVKESTPLQMKTRVDSNPHVTANVINCNDVIFQEHNTHVLHACTSRTRNIKTLLY